MSPTASTASTRTDAAAVVTAVGFACQVCGAAALAEISEFRALPRVTSDWKPFAAGGRLAACEACGAVQKYPEPAWIEEITGIYAAYDAYPQSGEVDQVVRDPRTKELRPRCAVLCDRLGELSGWPAE